MTRIRSNFQEGRIPTSMSGSDTEIHFDEVPNFPTISGGDHAVITIGEEILYLTEYTISESQGVVERGREGTSAVPHSTNSEWQHGVVASDHEFAAGSVFHGGDENFPRPAAHTMVTWFGWVEPLNMIDDDIWEEIPEP